MKSKKTFIIAEVSANHAHSIKNAILSVKAAKKAGADAVKFQTYTPDTLTLNCSNNHFRIKHPKWGGQTLYELYKKAYTPWSWFNKLKKVAEDEGIVFFSTAFDKSSVDFLENLNVPMYKIASFELVDLELIAYAAKTRKPLIISTGMASLKEIKEAVDTAKSAGAKDITLLKCVSSYPAKPQDMHLATISDIKKRFNVKVGLSDHSLGIGVSIAGVALGAEVIEKHFTLSHKIKTVDSFFSIDPAELKQLIENIRIAEKAIGGINYSLTADEKKNIFFRRSLFASQNIKKGELFNNDNMRSVRPASGLAPKYIKKILGRRAKKNINYGTPLSWELIK